MSRIRAYVTASALAHVVIAAFVGAAAAVLAPYLLTGAITVGVLRIAVYAGVSAALRALVLVLPSGSHPAAPPAPPVG